MRKKSSIILASILFASTLFAKNSSYPYSLTPFNNKLYFSADDGTNGSELWVSDGTESGTKLVKDINNGSGSSYPYNFKEYNGELYFYAYNGNKVCLYKSDGAESGTTKVSDVEIYDAESERWYDYNNNLTLYNDKLYFMADDGSNNGYELWQSDGTESGTKMLKEIDSSSDGSYPNTFTVFNDKLYFVAHDGSNGFELWESNGSEDGTKMVQDIANGSDSSLPWEFKVVGDRLFFTANGNGYSDNDLGDFYYEYYEYGDIERAFELYSFDGTNITKISDDDALSYANFGELNNKLYFNAYDSTNGYELWESNGSADGTKIVKDIYSGSSGSYPSYLTILNNKIYFRASNDLNGSELWESNGSSDGTNIVKDIYSGSSSSYPYNFTVLNDKLYFQADDNINGNELWESNGSADGTQMVKDIFIGDEDSSPRYLTVFNNKLYFRAEDEEAGQELWVSDGTESGTNLVADINYDNKRPRISNLQINGTNSVASILSVSYDYRDKENDEENGTLFLWYRADEVNGTNAILIQDNGLSDSDFYATSSTYTISADDIGKYISVRISPMDTNYLQNNSGSKDSSSEIKECLDENKSYCRSYDASYTTETVPSKVNLTSVITANKWSMITVPDDINISTSDISGATIFEYDSNNSVWKTPTILESYKGYWLYTSSTSGYEFISATKSKKEETIKSIFNNMPSDSFSLIGNSLSPMTYTTSISTNVDKNHAPIGYFSMFFTLSFISNSSRFCNIDEYYYDRENDTWNTTNGLPYLGGFWVSLSNCVETENDD